MPWIAAVSTVEMDPGIMVTIMEEEEEEEEEEEGIDLMPMRMTIQEEEIY